KVVKAARCDLKVIAGLRDRNHVEIGPERLRKVFPGMHGGISSHEILPPIFDRPVRIIIRQRLRVGKTSLIAEKSTASIIAFSRDQTRPEVVAKFVPKVSYERALRFLKGHPRLFAFDMIGL